MNRILQNRKKDIVFKYIGLSCTIFGVIILFIFLLGVFYQGLNRINWNFLMDFPSRKPEQAGILTAWTGTLWIFGLTALTAMPLGIFAGIYLEEYKSNNQFSKILEVNIANLAGVPSVIYGILGLEIFGRTFNLGGSLLTGSFTLSLLVLPIIIVVTRESLKAVPKTIREASYGLGASKWQTIWHQLLPASIGNIITGIVLALSRVVGETAPLIIIGALAYVPFVAQSPMDEFTVLPMQIFNWVSRPQYGFTVNASAAIIILLIIVFIMNGLAIYLRAKAKKRVKW